jgi:hypothetical protein
MYDAEHFSRYRGNPNYFLESILIGREVARDDEACHLSSTWGNRSADCRNGIEVKETHVKGIDESTSAIS